MTGLLKDNVLFHGSSKEPTEQKTNSPTRNADADAQCAADASHTRAGTGEEVTAIIQDGQLWKEPDCALHLEDGSVYEGWSFGAARSTSGEVVFNTGE
jgi:hypothetical protein